MRIFRRVHQRGQVSLSTVGFSRAYDDESAFVPSRDLSRIKVAEVLAINDQFRDETRSEDPADEPYEQATDRVLDTLATARESALAGMSFREFLDRIGGHSPESGGTGDEPQSAS